MNESQAIAVAELAKGTPQRDIAALTGISQPTICRINSKHRDLIQQEQARLIDATLSIVIGQTIRELHLPTTLTNDELLEPTKQAALSRIDKKAEMLLKSTGIAPSHNPSIHIQQIFNDNSKTLISPQVADLLGDRLNDIVEGEVIE